MRIVPALFLAILSFSLLSVEEVQIATFENADSLKKWHVRKNTQATLAKWPDNFPGLCVKLVLERYVVGNERWPAIVMTAPTLPSDWSNGKELQFDIYAETAGSLGYCLRSGFLRNQSSVDVPQGRSRVSIPLPEKGLDYGKMTELHLFQGAPAKDFVYYIGDISLIRTDAAELYAELLPRWNKIKENPSGIRTQLSKAEKTKKEAEKKIRANKYSQDASKTVEKWSEEISELEFQLQEQSIAALTRPDGLTALWATPMEKVHRDRQRFLNLPVAKGHITAAANEAEAIQLVLRSSRDLPAVSATISGNARTADGKEIPLKNLHVTPVGYVFCDQPLYAVPRTGYWPDPLLTYTNQVDLTKNLWQSFWVEAEIPSGQTPGNYTTEIAVRSGNRELCRLPLTITVNSFELPVGTPYSNVFSIAGSYSGDPRAKKDPERYRQAIRKELLDHRLNPSPLYDWRTPSVKDAREQLANGQKDFNIRYGIYGNDKNLNDYITQVKKAYQTYEKAGIADKAYCYVFDEAPPFQMPEISRKLAEVRKHIPNVRFLTTAYDGNKYGVGTPLHEIDMWCPQTPSYEKNIESVRQARLHGKKVWWYICCNPHLPYANIFIEYPSLCMRLLTGAMAWKFQPDGLLYYAVTYWGKNNKQLEHLFKRPPISGAPLTNWNGRSFDKFNGDGLLLYPGADGPVPTIRLKQLRDGLEDYFYWQLLQKALEDSSFMSQAWKKQAGEELKIRPELVHTLKDYAKDPQILLAQRERLAKLLNEYHQKKQHSGKNK